MGIGDVLKTTLNWATDLSQQAYDAAEEALGLKTEAVPALRQTPLYRALQPEPVHVPGTDITTEKPFVVQAEPNAYMWIALMGVDRATDILSPFGILPVTVGVGSYKRAVVAVTLFNYTDSPSGDYHEDVITILATEDPDRQSIGLTDLDDLLVYFKNPQSMEKGELLTMPDTPYVFAATNLHLDNDEAIAVGQWWLLNKKKAIISNTTVGKEQFVKVTDLEGNELIRASRQTRVAIPLSFCEWMRFTVPSRLETDPREMPNGRVSVVVNSPMGIDVYSLNDSLSFSGELASRYGPLTLVMGLNFDDLVAGFDWADRQTPAAE